MATWDSLLENRVADAIGAYLKIQHDRTVEPLPMDLEVLAGAIGAIKIVEREMIPEAGLDVQKDEFVIYVRSNFKDRPGELIRQRFSLAHEIAHTLFYSKRDGRLKPVKGGPRGLDLENACHEIASRLLIPDDYLPTRLESDQITADYVSASAKRFDVSLEVVLRRLERHPGLDTVHVSFVMCRSGSIEYANYPVWLRDLLPKRAGGSLQRWFRATDTSISQWFTAAGFELNLLTDGSFIASKDSELLGVRRLKVGTTIDLYEILGRLGLLEEALRERLTGLRS